MKTDEMYADVINELFDGAMQNVTPDLINDNVKYVADKMVTDIAQCSKGFRKLEFDLIYSATVGNLFGKLLEEIVKNGFARDYVASEIGNFLETLLPNVRYKTCVMAARSKYRSQMEIALLGL